ncbi:hypothetical protein GCM10007902_03630 [Dyella nitratireducens]|nr:hypothetical protein GCM10007902_03630 [Dyella nitratireducens]
MLAGCKRSLQHGIAQGQVDIGASWTVAGYWRQQYTSGAAWHKSPDIGPI